MTNNIFAIGDPHLGHKKVALARAFPEVQEHDDSFVRAWNDVVSKRDVVYVLGDVFKLDRVPELNGIKKLALGNHDKLPTKKYLDLFTKVQAYYEYDGCLLSHIPVHPGQFHRYEMNIHGHTHAHKIDDERYISVSVENCPFMQPQNLNALIAGRRDLIKNGPVENRLFEDAVKKRLGFKNYRWEKEGQSWIFRIDVPRGTCYDVDSQLWDLAYEVFHDFNFAFYISVGVLENS